ncbi:KinB-signaling pathway activation protein [Paenibacillus cremeus]|uniref:KinB signaling pathway activation protein n=1 Tax=Paenibacillus cremeus TaxID=2163881 RepID=A0A559JCG8_9BACL|nr:KinB-signaling pathway activation protein [Paenibacillus cremeus]TVX97567.1 KinB signaling pathway activation protein [Paenibacillus cremeus]
MTLRKWFYIFWTTILIGAVVGGIVGLSLQTMDQDFVFMGMSVMGYNFFWMLIAGALFSLISQVGFFAYLIIRFIGIGIIRNYWTWNMLQLLIMVVVLFDMAYLGYTNVVGTIILVLLCAAIAYFKVRITNKNALIPTFFFMTVGTLMEAQPALVMNNGFASVLFMMIPLFVCNAWQILILSKVLKTNKEPF